MEERETHKITTPLRGHVVVLKGWITGREKQKIDGAMFKDLGTQGEGSSLAPRISENMIANQENVAIEAVVVSVDGNELGVLDAVLDMRVKDFQAVIDQVKKVVDGDFDEKKEISSETNTSESLSGDKEESQTSVSL